MVNECRVVSNLYRDSVALMQISASVAALPGVTQAYVVMATPANLELLTAAGLSGGEAGAASNDIVIAVQGQDPDVLQQAMQQAVDSLESTGSRPTNRSGPAVTAPRSIEMGLDVAPGANLALISTPGEYAAAEAWKALRLGLHVMIFSDNVSLADEIEIKQVAQEHGLLVMGPDCGTTIIDGVPLGFANVVRRGNIGIVSASGTGLQQVACLIDRLGGGLSQAIGTGGRDLRAEVGGITMRQGIAQLAANPATDVIVLISKPPAASVAEVVLTAAEACGKPVVVNFIGAPPPPEQPWLSYARTLADAATLAVTLAGVEQRDPADGRSSLVDREWLAETTQGLASGQRYIRGLFSGGTFCYEAALLLEEELGDVYSNIATDPERRLDDVWHSRQHTLLDLGDDIFTRGRPHPMIDHRLRNQRIVQEAQDPDVAVLLIDVVLGYGAHPDPAAEMVPAISEAIRLAQDDGRALIVIGWLCGTDGDPQQIGQQQAAFECAGVKIVDSSTQAIQLAAEFIRQLAD